MEEFTFPFLAELKTSDYLAPEDYNYWKCRQQRLFFIDYEIEESYQLIELSKVIMQMNFEERAIPKEELKPIYICIFSYGGDLDQATYFCDLLLSSRIPIITIGTGVAMSAGFSIFLAGHKRYSFKNCQMLIHSGSGSVQGTAEQVEEAQKNYKKRLDILKNYIIDRTTIDEKTFNKNRKKDWYITGEDIIKYGIADKLIESFEDIME